LIVLTIMFCAGMAAALWHLSSLSLKLIESAALQGTSLRSSSLEELRKLYTSEVVDRLMTDLNKTNVLRLSPIRGSSYGR
jgi:hypothetical protein